MKNLSNNPNKGIANKGGRPVQEEKKDKIVSLRVDNKTYAMLAELSVKLGYTSLSAFIIDMLLTKAGSPKKYTPFNPDIERLFCDVEAALQYGLRLEKRAENFVDKDIVEDLQGEIQHFKIFIARKAEVLLDRVRDEYFNQKRS
jgi:hypothetical protein